MVSLKLCLKCYSDVFIVSYILLLSVWNVREMQLMGCSWCQTDTNKIPSLCSQG